MASSLIARRTPSISKLLKPYHPSSSSSAYACLFSQDASGNPSRELHRDPTLSSSASAVPREHPKSGAPLSPAGAAFDPIRRSLLFGGGGQGFTRAASGPILFSSSASESTQCIMKSLYSKSKVLTALSMVDLVGLAWVSYLTHGSSIWAATAAASNQCDLFAFMVVFNYGMRYYLKSPNFTELDMFKPVLMAADFIATYYVITFTYYLLKSAVQLDSLLA